MDDRKGANRFKRHLKSLCEDSWDCSVCTYRNSAEAYKCEMCDVRKGTSTRKPRPNPQLVAAQVAQQYGITPSHPRTRDDQTSSRISAAPVKSKHIQRRPRLKNIDRSSAKQTEVTVGSVTVVITDYQPKRSSRSSTDVSRSFNADSSDHNTSLITNDIHHMDLESEDDCKS